MGIVPDNESVYYSSIVNVIDTSMFSNDDLQLFCDSTEFIDKTRKRRRSRQKSRLNNSAQLSREEIFEVSEVDEKEYLKIATSACNDIDVNIKNLSADIEKIFESFNDNISVYDAKDVGVECKSINNVTYKKEETKARINTTGSRNMSETMLKTPVSKSRSNLQITSTPNNNISQLVNTWEARNATSKNVEKCDGATVSSVKAKISFFNQLSKATYGSHLSKVPKQQKLVPEKTCNTRESDRHAESDVWVPNFVKCRIKQFEKGEVNESVTDVANNYANNSKEEPLRYLSTEKLVSKLRSKYDTTDKTLPKLQHNPKESSGFSRHLNAPRKCSVQPSNKCSVESPMQFPSPIISQCKLTSIQETEDIFQKEFSLETSPTEKPSLKKYDPFAESEKSLKRLGDIVHTIRSIREQGMTEISRDLFQIFKKSLIAANAKLAESKRHSMHINSANKRIAAVRPNVVPCSTFPRVLKAIPKSPPGNIATTNLHGPRNESSDLELTYERFVSSLERDMQK